MILSHKIRLFPTEEQEQLLWKHINISRFVWNYGLALQTKRYKNDEKHLSGYDLRKEFTQLKQQENYQWLKEISSHTISNVCLDLDDAYKRLFKKQAKRPRFKIKNKCKKSFPVRVDNFYLINNCANIEKIGKIKYHVDMDFPQGKDKIKFSNPRIKFENNKWILSFGIEYKKQTHELTDKTMGIDLGIKSLAVVSFDDVIFEFNNVNKAQRVKNLKSKLKHLQRNVNRKHYTNNKNKVFEDKWHKSNNIIELENQIRKIYTKLSNIRTDYIHQITHRLIEMCPKAVIMEDLNISGMMKNKHLSKAIAEQCLYEFIRQMKYKCEFNGIEFYQVDRFYPSSKTCSNCGYIKKNLRLSDRIYVCDKCGFEIDRDVNAAINLMNYSVV